MSIQGQEASRTLNRLNQNKTTPWHIITTSTENRERQKKQIICKGKPFKITADFSTETLKARRAWSKVFQALNENNFNLRILYAAKLFKIEGAMKVFHNKQKLKQYMTTKSLLQKILQGILHTENESKQNHESTGNTKPREKTRNQRETLIQLHTIKPSNNKNN
jgi:hypothetical protein